MGSAIRPRLSSECLGDPIGGNLLVTSRVGEQTHEHHDDRDDVHDVADPEHNHPTVLVVGQTTQSPHARTVLGMVGGTPPMLRASFLVSEQMETVRSSRIGSTTPHHSKIPAPMKLRCSMMCTGTVGSVGSSSEGMCQKRSTALKIATAGHGRVTAHQMVRNAVCRSRGAGRAPAIPRRSSGGATIIKSMCCTMCIEKRYRSPPRSIGDCSAIKVISNPLKNSTGRQR